MAGSNGPQRLRGEFIVHVGSLSLEAVPSAPDSDLDPRPDGAAREEPKHSEERYLTTSFIRGECPKRMHRAGERSRRGSVAASEQFVASSLLF